MQKLKFYGIKSISINGIILHTFLIKMVNSPFNKEKLIEYGLDKSISEEYCYAGKCYITVSEVHLDVEYFQKRVFILGKCLKEIALNNLELKYQWCQPESIQLPLIIDSDEQ